MTGLERDYLALARKGVAALERLAAAAEVAVKALAEIKEILEKRPR